MSKQIPYKSNYSIAEKWFYGFLFVILILYAILRALMVVPMLDELSTFYSYIRTGNYFNSESLSANNHILNSFIGHHLYNLFGDSFFLFRISSLAAFPIYFFSLKHIVKECLPKITREVVFIAMVCIPWLFEYFSYSRGYSMGIAFYFAAISYTLKWTSKNQSKYLIGIFICLWISLAANLTYLLPSLSLLLFIEFLFIIKKDFSKPNLAINGLLILGWSLATKPFIDHSFKLREAGELWWGNQDGLWETTGKSLSKLVLFTESSWVYYLIVTLLIGCTISFFLNWRKNNFLDYLKKPEALIFILFTGNLSGIVIMRYMFDVNYPMDRVGMYLVPFFILFISLFLSKQNYLKHINWGLLFFPLSFAYFINLNTSIFSPEDRIPASQTDAIKSSLTDETALSAEYVSHMSYAHSCRDDKKVHMAYTADGGESSYGDYHIAWQGCYPSQGYSFLTEHPVSRTCFKKQDRENQKTLIVDTVLTNLQFSNEYFTILKRPIDSTLLSGKIQVQLSAELEFERPTLKFNMVQLTKNDSDDTQSSRSTQFNWYFSDRTDVNFVFMDQVIQLRPEETHFNFFLLNGDLINIDVEFVRVRIYKIS